MKTLKKDSKKLFRVSYSLGYYLPDYFVKVIKAKSVRDAEKKMHKYLADRKYKTAEICDIMRL